MFGSASAAYWLACQCVGWDLWRVGPIRWKGLVRTLLWWSAMTTSKNITHSTEKIEMRKIQVKTSKKQVNKGPKWLFKGFKGHSSKIQVLKVLKVTLLPLLLGENVVSEVLCGWINIFHFVYIAIVCRKKRREKKQLRCEASLLPDPQVPPVTVWVGRNCTGFHEVECKFSC